MLIIIYINILFLIQLIDYYILIVFDDDSIGEMIR